MCVCAENLPNQAFVINVLDEFGICVVGSTLPLQKDRKMLIKKTR